MWDVFPRQLLLEFGSKFLEIQSGIPVGLLKTFRKHCKIYSPYELTPKDTRGQHQPALYFTNNCYTGKDGGTQRQHLFWCWQCLWSHGRYEGECHTDRLYGSSLRTMGARIIRNGRPFLTENPNIYIYLI